MLISTNSKKNALKTYRLYTGFYDYCNSFESIVVFHIEINHLICKSVRIWSFSGPNFPVFGLNTDQQNSEYGHFSKSND